MNCVTCKNDTTPLSTARRLQACVNKVVTDLDTINGMEKAARNVPANDAMIQVSDNLNERIFDNLLQVKSLTDSLLDDNFTLPTI